MAELLKNKYNNQSIYELALKFKIVDKTFKVDEFVNDVIDHTWNQLALKQRMRQISTVLGKHLPNDYEKALRIIDQVLATYPQDFNDFTLMYFPDFVEVHGQKDSDWDLSIQALQTYTCSSSSEFAVRPFIINNQSKMMQQMLVWSKHENAHVRRLASEGCRPRLPWGQALTCFKQDPHPIIPILENLKADDSLYVRKSVANNLNDISKTHPALVEKIAFDWYGKNQLTNWIVKHGCRTLLKKGHKNLLALFGFEDTGAVKIKNFRLTNSDILIGQNLEFTFEMFVTENSKIRLEYRIDYVKANQTINGKIFHISESNLNQGQTKCYTKKHSFANLSSRKHYSGEHFITVIVNGAEQNRQAFNVFNQLSNHL